MTSTRIRKSVWLLLALLALRGLVPAGYMIDASDGFALVVCGSGIYQAAAKQHGEHHHHHGKESSAQSEHSICPFAIAATGATASNLPPISGIAAVVIDRLVGDQAVVVALSGPSRAQQSRAPPYFS